MASLEYKEAVSELLNILESTDEELIKKIPAELIVFWEENKSEEYFPELDHNLSLDELKLKTKTKELIAMIYLNYLCDAEKKKQIKKILKENEKIQKEQEELQIKNIFNKDKEDNIKIENQNEIEEREKENKNEIKTSTNIDNNEKNITKDIYMVKQEDNIFYKIIEKLKRFLRKIIYR